MKRTSRSQVTSPIIASVGQRLPLFVGDAIVLGPGLVGKQPLDEARPRARTISPSSLRCGRLDSASMVSCLRCPTANVAKRRQPLAVDFITYTKLESNTRRTENSKDLLVRGCDEFRLTGRGRRVGSALAVS